MRAGGRRCGRPRTERQSRTRARTRRAAAPARPVRSRSACGKTISPTVTPAGGVDREHRRDERRIARRIGLNVEPIGDADLQRGADGGRRRALGFDERRQLGLDAAKLRVSDLRRDQQQRDCRGQRSHGYPTGLSGMNAAARLPSARCVPSRAAGPDTGNPTSSVPTGSTPAASCAPESAARTAPCRRPRTPTRAAPPRSPAARRSSRLVRQRQTEEPRRGSPGSASPPGLLPAARSLATHACTFPWSFV